MTENNEPPTGAFVSCRRTDNAASASPIYHLLFGLNVINWAIELTMNFYIFIRHLYHRDVFQIPPQTQMLNR